MQQHKSPKASENAFYLDTASSPFCAVATSDLLLLSTWGDGESNAGFFEDGSAEIGFMLARLTPLPTTPRSFTVLPVLPVGSKLARLTPLPTTPRSVTVLPVLPVVDIVEESKPVPVVAICEEVKDAALGIALTSSFCS
jgi:hypothetical protein